MIAFQVLGVVTHLCLMVCPSDPPPLQQSINEEWRTHTPNPFFADDFTLDAYQLPTRRPSTPRSTPATSEPSPPSHSTGVEQWRSLVTAYFAGDQVERALCIMDHESGGDPGAANPTSSAAGLFQFLKSTWDNMVPSSVTGGSYSSGQVYNPEANIRSAAWLQQNVGWTQWSPYQRGNCR